jgi:uncharacterized membrane protein YeiB
MLHGNLKTAGTGYMHFNLFILQLITKSVVCCGLSFKFIPKRNMQPTTAKSRILTVDALRGVALLGIMLAHFIYWYTQGRCRKALPENLTTPERSCKHFYQSFCYGKVLFLFFVSFRTELFPADARLGNEPKRFLARYSWRLLS